MSKPPTSDSRRTVWLVVAVAVLAVAAVAMYWPAGDSAAGIPKPLTVADVQGFDDEHLVDSTQRDIQWRMVRKDMAPDTWKHASEPVKHVYIIATCGTALAKIGLQGYASQLGEHPELPGFRDLGAAYAAIGSPRMASVLVRAATTADAASHAPKPANPFVQLDEELKQVRAAGDPTKALAAYIRTHEQEIFFPAAIAGR